MPKRSNDGPIPQARNIINDVIDRIKAGTISGVQVCNLLDTAERLMHRAPAIRIGQATTRNLDPAEKAEVRRFAAANPSMTQLAIAAKYGTNPGRVSEALNFK